MNLVKRDPKTGRFVSTKNVEATVGKTTKKVSPKVKNQGGEMQVKFLVNPLAVYGKKSLEGSPSNIKPGTTVQITKVDSDLFRVKKENSARTFYTKQEAILSAT